VPVNLTLSEDLVREARMLTADLSKTVEQLLTTCIARERSKRAEEQHAIDAVITATTNTSPNTGFLARISPLLWLSSTFIPTWAGTGRASLIWSMFNRAGMMPQAPGSSFH
jgi:hypothetical protein